MYAEQARILYVSFSRNSPGELAYLDAYKLLRDNGLDAAKPPMLQIVVNFSQDDVAPRALYALGESYEEAARYDSALAYYRRVLKEYPYSSYALALRPRLADASNPGLPHAPSSHILTPLITPQDSTVPSDQTQQPTPQQVQPTQNPGNNPQRPPAVVVPGQLLPGQLPPGAKQPPLPPNFRQPPPPPPPPPLPIDPGTSH
jgi:tetratricopeptide (TPR) repeat protein